MQASTGGRVVLLTGAAGGIGRIIAHALLTDGHAVAAVDRDATGLDRLLAEAGAGERLHATAADLMAEAGCLAAFAAAQRHFGRVDALINNAGIGVSSLRPDAEALAPTIEELTPAIFDRFFAIFVRAPQILTRAAVPGMRARGFGRIVNVTTSYRTMLRILPYGAAKAALESMSAIWATELAGSGVTVNVLVPGGPTDTPMVGAGSGWARDRMLRPAIMGPPAAWLISSRAGDFNGRRITAARWDVQLPPDQAAERASRPIGWPELSADAVWVT